MSDYILVFKLPPKKKNVDISKFCQKFYGQDSSSCGGKYHYHRHGLLDDIPHRKLSRGVILIKKNALDVVLGFLKSYKAEVHVRDVKLTDEDRKIMKEQA